MAWEILFKDFEGNWQPLWGRMEDHSSANGNRHFVCKREAKLEMGPETSRDGDEIRYRLNRVGEAY